MTKFNSRQKRKYRSYGMTAAEAQEVIAELKKLDEKFRPVHCSCSEYRKTDEKHRQIIKEAQRLGLAGKHAGSKSTKALKSRIDGMNKLISRYATALNAMERLKKQTEDGENN